MTLVSAPERKLSWWLAEAHEEAEPPAPPLEGTTSADICIVGGGYTGVWSAIQF